MTETFLNGRVTLHADDCLEVLATLPENGVDSCVTDPPYHLTSIVKRFGGENAAPAQFGSDGRFARASAGFMGRKWDGGDIAFRPETWAAVYRVLKPGAHLIAFGGCRTYHRMACAIEDVGFEIRDQIQWLYGSGFPKSHDVSKGIDRAAGAEREIVGQRDWSNAKMVAGQGISGLKQSGSHAGEYASERTNVPITAPATDAAHQWQGWGTGLKPANEPIVLARKPLSEKTVAANVLRWGTGAINVDGCRVEAAPEQRTRHNGSRDNATSINMAPAPISLAPATGRWPANVIHDGSEEVVGAFPDAGGGFGKRGGERDSEYRFGGTMEVVGYGDEGSAARFFYSAKADIDDRLGSKHPTIKPVNLVQYLVRLVTPKGGTCLDLFAGTGTTGEAAWREGMRAVLIEREPEYQADIRRRMALCLSGPDERARESIKARTKDKRVDHGPLFGGVA